MNRFKLFLCVFTTLMMFSELSFALQAIVVKGNRVLFSLDQREASTLSTNTLVVSTDKTTQVKLIQVRGPRAVGQVLKGNAKVNMSFRPLVGDNKRSESLFGVLVGVSLNTMTIKLSSSNTLKLQGTGFNAMGFVDFPLFADINLRGLVGYEGFKASVASTTCPSGTCSVTLNYLSAEGFAQYDLSNAPGGSRYWLGLGVGGLMSLSASSEIINTDSMKTNQIFILGGGADVRLSPTTYLPIQVDYFLYPDGDIKTQQINLRLGYKF